MPCKILHCLRVLLAASALPADESGLWTDITDASGIGQHAVSRARLIDKPACRP